MRDDISSIIIGLYCTTLAKIDNFSIILWLTASGEIEWSQIEEVCRRDVDVSKGWTGLWLILLKCIQNSVKHIRWSFSRNIWLGYEYASTLHFPSPHEIFHWKNHWYIYITFCSNIQELIKDRYCYRLRYCPKRFMLDVFRVLNTALKGKDQHIRCTEFLNTVHPVFTTVTNK